ncbi:alpha/beta fold hydrolase [Salinicola peritrichatus]|uniref:alpha/beta fold hydrolase n=1 Tax=Salinicola peritrichatus TaxID=1267424 RepID=UPI0019550E34|nr:alpha/beta hydrolase [Salinicola peritrichatus]
MMPPVTHHQVDARGISLHVVEQGSGPAVLFCHGFPTTWYSWRSAMEATAASGFRAIALDMRGYGDSDAPEAAHLYTAFHTVGDLVAVLDYFGIESTILVGHDFGASIAWNAAMMRPDRVGAVFAISVSFRVLGEASFLDQIRAAGKSDFYMFGQMRAEADAEWADAERTIPASLYWLSGEAPADERWDPFDPEKNMLRPVANPPESIAPDYIEEMIRVFGKTGFHAPLNYYRSIDDYFVIANRAFSGAMIHQPSFFLTGKADGLNLLLQPTEESLRHSVPGLRGFAELDGVGHWPQLEAPKSCNTALVEFLKSLT